MIVKSLRYRKSSTQCNVFKYFNNMWFIYSSVYSKNKSVLRKKIYKSTMLRQIKKNKKTMATLFFLNFHFFSIHGFYDLTLRSVKNIKFTTTVQYYVNPRRYHMQPLGFRRLIKILYKFKIIIQKSLLQVKKCIHITVFLSWIIYVKSFLFSTNE